MTLTELRHKRGQAIEQARAIVRNAEGEKRSVTTEEDRQFDAFMAEADTYKAQIERIERLETEERSLEGSQGRRTDTRTVETADTFRTWLREGHGDLSFDLRSDAPTFNEDRAAWEQRAQSSGTPSAGGYVIPTGFVNSLEVALLAFGGMRQAARVIRTRDGGPLPWITENDTAQKGAILAESAAVADQDLAFGQLTFGAFKYTSKQIKVPVELMQDSAFDLNAEIGTRLAERIARIQNDHFTTGTGTGQPLGLVTAATTGVTGATGTTTSITYDALVDLQHSVDPAYRSGATFMFHDTTLAKLKKLKDSNGQPLWQPGLAAKAVDTILGHNYVVNQSMPVMAANAKSIVFGDLTKYVIRDVMSVDLIRLSERYADLHQIGFLAIARADGKLVDAGTNPVKLYVNSAT